MGNVLATVWGLITFAGFVVALLIPKAEEYVRAYWETAEEGARARARKWSSAARTAPLIVCGAVAVLCVVSALALRGSGEPTRVDVGMLAVAWLTQAGFAVAVRYLVVGVPRAMPVVLPAHVPDLSVLRSRDGPRTALRFANESHTALRVLWVDHGGSEHAMDELPPGTERVQLTYAGHPFVVRTAAGGQFLAVYLPLPVPGTATLSDTMTAALRP
ncbi:VHL beta domain-containing protein [Streptomyces flavalbus]|uniref:von Hippel-Lindau disease tumour suppressor beta domain-containing protein n=1 Tax=Streptomyces flavalbus TaxID=2665155 RepID=A0ABW2WCL9_9ACTN